MGSQHESMEKLQPSLEDSDAKQLCKQLLSWKMMALGLSELEQSMLGFRASEDARTPMVAGAASDFGRQRSFAIPKMLEP